MTIMQRQGFTQYFYPTGPKFPPHYKYGRHYPRLRPQIFQDHISEYKESGEERADGSHDAKNTKRHSDRRYERDLSKKKEVQKSRESIKVPRKERPGIGSEVSSDKISKIKSSRARPKGVDESDKSKKSSIGNRDVKKKLPGFYKKWKNPKPLRNSTLTLEWIISSIGSKKEYILKFEKNAGTGEKSVDYTVRRDGSKSSTGTKTPASQKKKSGKSRDSNPWREESTLPQGKASFLEEILANSLQKELLHTESTTKVTQESARTIAPQKWPVNNHPKMLDFLDFSEQQKFTPKKYTLLGESKTDPFQTKLNDLPKQISTTDLAKYEATVPQESPVISFPSGKRAIIFQEPLIVSFSPFKNAAASQKVMIVKMSPTPTFTILANGEITFPLKSHPSPHTILPKPDTSSRKHGKPKDGRCRVGKSKRDRGRPNKEMPKKHRLAMN